MAFQYAVVLALVATAYAGVLAPLGGVSVSQQSQDTLGNAAFNHQVVDGLGATNGRSEVRTAAGVVGSYNLADIDGRARRVDYVADAAGFRAKVHTNEPGTALSATGASLTISPYAGPVAPAPVAPIALAAAPVAPIALAAAPAITKTVVQSAPLAYSTLGAPVLNAGLLNGGLYNGGLYNGGLYNGGLYNGGLYNGGLYNGGLYNGGLYNGGLYNGGLYNGGLYGSPLINQAGYYGSPLLHSGIVGKSIHSGLRLI